MSNKQRCRIENWAIQGNSYAAPEARKLYLVGNVYGHPVERHFDGKVVTTSRILRIDLTEVETRNTIYKLGEIDPDYKEYLESLGKTWEDFIDG